MVDTVAQRQSIEKRIVRRVAMIALAHDYTVTVNDGDDDVVVRSRDLNTIMRATMSTDEDMFRLIGPDGRSAGCVWFVYGNDGYDVISDYSVNLECMLTAVMEFADTLEASHGRL